MKHEHIQEIDSYVPIPENYKDAILLMQSDFYRCYARKLSLFEMYFTLIPQHYNLTLFISS